MSVFHIICLFPVVCLPLVWELVSWSLLLLLPQTLPQPWFLFALVGPVHMQGVNNIVCGCTCHRCQRTSVLYVYRCTCMQCARTEKQELVAWHSTMLIRPRENTGNTCTCMCCFSTHHTHSQSPDCVCMTQRWEGPYGPQSQDQKWPSPRGCSLCCLPGWPMLWGGLHRTATVSPVGRRSSSHPYP